MPVSHSAGSLAAPRGASRTAAVAVAAVRAMPWVLAAALAVPPATANVYKCATATGGSIYQEDPCPPGKELRNFDTDPPDLSIIPGMSAPPPAAPAAASARPAPSPSKTASRTAAGRDDRSNGKVDADATGRKFIRAGMTDAEVRARIGQPDITSGSSRSRNARWSYLPTAGDPDTITTITFAGNEVSDVTRKLVKK